MDVETEQVPILRPEEEIAAGLLEAQSKANALFAWVESENLIRPGRTELEINEDIYALAERTYGITRYWHKTNRPCRSQYARAL